VVLVNRGQRSKRILMPTIREESRIKEVKKKAR